MDKIKIQRINELAKKAKTEGLTEEERAEQKLLRDEYRADFRKSLIFQLDNIEFVDENKPKREGS